MKIIDQTLVSWKNLSKEQKDHIIENAKELKDEYSFINDAFDYEMQNEFEDVMTLVKEQLFSYGIEKMQIYTNVIFSAKNIFQFKILEVDVYKFLSSMNRDGFFKDIFGMPGTVKENFLKEFLSSFRLVSRQVDLNINEVEGPFEIVLANYLDERLVANLRPQIKEWYNEWINKFKDEKRCNKEMTDWYNEFCLNTHKKLDKVFNKSQKEIDRTYHKLIDKLDEEDGLYFYKSENDLIISDFSKQDFYSLNLQ